MAKAPESRGDRARRQIVHMKNLSDELDIIVALHDAIGPDAVVTITNFGDRAKADLSNYPNLREALRSWLEGRAGDIEDEIASNVKEGFGGA